MLLFLLQLGLLQGKAQDGLDLLAGDQYENMYQLNQQEQPFGASRLGLTAVVPGISTERGIMPSGNQMTRNIGPIFQQEEATPVNWAIFSAVTATLAGSYTGLYLYARERWSNRPTVPFHFNEQLYAKGFDKLGHFYAASSQALITSRLYDFSDIGRARSALLGSGIALSAQTLVEILDGRTSSLGFDRYDQLGNILGVSWFYARENSTFLRRFNIRWFYYPSGRTASTQSAYENKAFTDYNSQSYWVSMRIWDLLPEKIQPYWPRFLVPTAGVSLNNWKTNADPAYVSYHLSLNLDFTQIFPQKTKFGRLLGDLFNSVYLPAPAVELHPNPSVKLIFYGQD
ncbi:DUF2279 domain-containing protein [Halalkalibaculum sp. DA3122]